MKSTLTIYVDLYNKIMYIILYVTDLEASS